MIEVLADGLPQVVVEVVIVPYLAGRVKARLVHRAESISTLYLREGTSQLERARTLAEAMLAITFGEDAAPSATPSRHATCLQLVTP